MEKQEYIELQSLLTKLRANCMEEIGNPEMTSSQREQLYKLIRNVDSIRRNMPIKLGEGKIVII